MSVSSRKVVVCRTFSVWSILTRTLYVRYLEMKLSLGGIELYFNVYCGGFFIFPVWNYHMQTKIHDLYDLFLCVHGAWPIALLCVTRIATFSSIFSFSGLGRSVLMTVLLIYGGSSLGTLRLYIFEGTGIGRALLVLSLGLWLCIVWDSFVTVVRALLLFGDDGCERSYFG